MLVPASDPQAFYPSPVQSEPIQTHRGAPEIQPIQLALLHGIRDRHIQLSNNI
jgi:hypothetical protein